MLCLVPFILNSEPATWRRTVTLDGKALTVELRRVRGNPSEIVVFGASGTLARVQDTCIAILQPSLFWS